MMGMLVSVLAFCILMSGNAAASESNLNENALLNQYLASTLAYTDLFDSVSNEDVPTGIQYNINAMLQVLERLEVDNHLADKVSAQYRQCALLRLVGYYSLLGDNAAVGQLLRKQSLEGPYAYDDFNKKLILVDRYLSVHLDSERTAYERKLRRSLLQAGSFNLHEAYTRYNDLVTKIRSSGLRNEEKRMYESIIETSLKNYISAYDLRTGPAGMFSDPSELMKTIRLFLNNNFDRIVEEAPQILVSIMSTVLSHSRILGLPRIVFNYDDPVIFQKKGYAELSKRFDIHLTFSEHFSLDETITNLETLNKLTHPNSVHIFSEFSSVEDVNQNMVLVHYLFSNDKKEALRWLLADLLIRYDELKEYPALIRQEIGDENELQQNYQKMRNRFKNVLHSMMYGGYVNKLVGDISNYFYNTLICHSLEPSLLQTSLDGRINWIKSKTIGQMIRQQNSFASRLSAKLKTIEKHARQDRSYDHHHGVRTGIAHHNIMLEAIRCRQNGLDLKGNRLLANHLVESSKHDLPAHNAMVSLARYAFFRPGAIDADRVIRWIQQDIAFKHNGLQTSTYEDILFDNCLLFLTANREHVKAINLSDWRRQLKYAAIKKRLDQLAISELSEIRQLQLAVVNSINQNDPDGYIDHLISMSTKFDKPFNMFTDDLPSSALLQYISPKLATAGDNNLVIIFSYQGEWAIHLWAIQNGSISNHRVIPINSLLQELYDGKAPSNELRMINDLLLEPFRQDMTKPSFDVKKLRKKHYRSFMSIAGKSEKFPGGQRIAIGFCDPQLLKNLYQILLRPISAQLHKETSLLFIVDGIQSMFPLAALIDSNGRYLVERINNISYAASLRSYLESKMSFRTGGDVSMFGLHNFKHLPPLDYVCREMNNIQQAIPKERAAFLYGDCPGRHGKASTGQFLKAIGEGEIVHLSTHGIFGVDSLLSSFFILDDRPIGLIEMITNRKNDAPALIALASCDSSLSQLSQSKENLSVVNLVHYYYKTNVIGSLWKVQDRASSYLMKNFYDNLLRMDKKPSEALAQAQRIFIKEKVPVYLWANYTVFGY
jgi:hypothetical protein